jgi:hypothetical protein
MVGEVCLNEAELNSWKKNGAFFPIFCYYKVIIEIETRGGILVV